MRIFKINILVCIFERIVQKREWKIYFIRDEGEIKQQYYKNFSDLDLLGYMVDWVYVLLINYDMFNFFLGYF